MNKKYKVIAKVKDGRFVKYNVTNLLKFTTFLENEFGGFLYFNVYRWTKSGNGEQIASFTKNNRPNSAHVS